MFGQEDFMPSGRSQPFKLKPKFKRDKEKIDAEHEAYEKLYSALVGYLKEEIKNRKESSSQDNVGQFQEALSLLEASGPGVFLNPRVRDAFNNSLSQALEVLVQEIPRKKKAA